VNAFKGTTGIVVLFSGGVDSTVLATMALRKKKLAACVLIDYGQPAFWQEQNAASDWCEANDVMFIAARSMLPVVRMELGTGVEGPRVVPLRNAVMLGMACAYAVQLGVNEVWYGAIADDAADYPDCRSSWIMDFNRVSEVEGVHVRAPLVRKSKAEVLAMADAFGVDLESCWSCYEPTKEGQACETCNSCRSRLGSLEE
jgi:7-cyano-7-deazaguanine synthase